MDFALNASHRDEVDFGDFNYDQTQNFVELDDQQERDRPSIGDKDDSGLSFDEKLHIVQAKLEKCQTAVTVFMRLTKGPPPEQTQQKMKVLQQQQQLFQQVLDLHKLLVEPVKGDLDSLEDSSKSIRQKTPEEHTAYRLVQAGKLPGDPAFEESSQSFKFVTEERRRSEYLIIYQAWLKVKKKAFDNCLYRAHDNQLLVDIDNDESVREELWQLKQSKLVFHQQEQELERREVEEAQRREEQERQRVDQLLKQEDEYFKNCQQHASVEEAKQDEKQQTFFQKLKNRTNNAFGSVFNKEQAKQQKLQQQAHDEMTMQVMEQRKEDIKNVASLMKDMRELTEEQARELLKQEQPLEETHEEVHDALEHSAQAGEEIKEAYVTNARSGRNKLMAGLAVVGGVVGTVATGGIAGGVILAVGGGIAGRAAGNKVVEKAKDRAGRVQFERADDDQTDQKQ